MIESCLLGPLITSLPKFIVFFTCILDTHQLFPFHSLEILYSGRKLICADSYGFLGFLGTVYLYQHSELIKSLLLPPLFANFIPKTHHFQSMSVMFLEKIATQSFFQHV